MNDNHNIHYSFQKFVPFCVGCGFELQHDWNACANCGKIISKSLIDEPEDLDNMSNHKLGSINTSKSKKIMETPLSRHEIMFKDKSPGMAVLASLLLPGAGHLYTDRVGEGLVMMFLYLFLAYSFLVSPNSIFLAVAIIITYAYIIFDVLYPGGYGM